MKVEAFCRDKYESLAFNRSSQEVTPERHRLCSTMRLQPGIWQKVFFNIYFQTQTFSLWALPFRRVEVGGDQIYLRRNAFLVEKSSAPRDDCQQRAGVTKLQILKNGLSQKRNLSILAASPVKNSMRFDSNNENKHLLMCPMHRSGLPTLKELFSYVQRMRTLQ